jgi:hypothetical protein
LNSSTRYTPSLQVLGIRSVQCNSFLTPRQKLVHHRFTRRLGDRDVGAFARSNTGPLPGFPIVLGVFRRPVFSPVGVKQRPVVFPEKLCREATAEQCRLTFSPSSVTLFIATLEQSIEFRVGSHHSGWLPKFLFEGQIRKESYTTRQGFRLVERCGNLFLNHDSKRLRFSFFNTLADNSDRSRIISLVLVVQKYSETRFVSRRTSARSGSFSRRRIDTF